MAKGRRDTRLAAPYMRALCIDDPDQAFPDHYPFTLPWLSQDFELEFDQPVTILMGENGSGKSTLLEAIAATAGFPTSGGGMWGNGAAPQGTAELAQHFRASWLPKMTKGWFLKAQSFAAVSDQTAKDYLAYSCLLYTSPSPRDS